MQRHFLFQHPLKVADIPGRRLRLLLRRWTFDLLGTSHRFGSPISDRLRCGRKYAHPCCIQHILDRWRVDGSGRYRLEGGRGRGDLRCRCWNVVEPDWLYGFHAESLDRQRPWRYLRFDPCRLTKKLGFRAERSDGVDNGCDIGFCGELRLMFCGGLDRSDLGGHRTFDGWRRSRTCLVTGGSGQNGCCRLHGQIRFLDRHARCHDSCRDCSCCRCCDDSRDRWRRLLRRGCNRSGRHRRRTAFLSYG